MVKNKHMKNIKRWALAAGAVVALGASSCSKWTEPTQYKPTDLSGNTTTEDYYANLRAWKATGAPTGFGWFAGWTGEGASMKTQLMGLPDSLGLVSLWGDWKNMNDLKRADLKAVQTLKGTKVIAGFIIDNVGVQMTPAGQDAAKYWGWEDGTSPEALAKQKVAIQKYANAICDLIDSLGLDGFDFDFEPSYGHSGNISFNYNANYSTAGKKIKADNMKAFIETLGKRLGPQSGTGRILTVNGEPQSMVPELGKYFDYFIVQAYDSSGDADLDRRFQSTVRNYAGHLPAAEVARKYLVTENYEKYASTGGAPNYRDRYGNTMASVEGMARWMPIVDGKVLQKAGVGTYHMEYEYTVSGQPGTYPALRRAIRIMNPPVK